MLQGGELTHRNGTSEKSIYGLNSLVTSFIRVDKNFVLKRSKLDFSRWQTQEKIPMIRSQHVVFGEVVEGMDVIKAVETEGPSSGKKSLSPCPRPGRAWRGKGEISVTFYGWKRWPSSLANRSETRKLHRSSTPLYSSGDDSSLAIWTLPRWVQNLSLLPLLCHTKHLLMAEAQRSRRSRKPSNNPPSRKLSLDNTDIDGNQDDTPLPTTENGLSCCIIHTSYDFSHYVDQYPLFLKRLHSWSLG
ncbi:hypothetical protein K435DRAFT_878031 [Dendrothele bispora CBS 962.96]|uniref:PPIase cyclophilin-type domain-containing protein n=1 Tax=Dendrothele bispora (strain CBS 962.96) TaxID=1314807 RepID=A0A4V6T4W4_DENBC|nr:hypothetical protein K435DRAFT_878031 [Dendrothele bispora CBS 962.96]